MKHFFFCTRAIAVESDYSQQLGIRAINISNSQLLYVMRYYYGDSADDDHDDPLCLTMLCLTLIKSSTVGT